MVALRFLPPTVARSESVGAVRAEVTVLSSKNLPHSESDLNPSRSAANLLDLSWSENFDSRLPPTLTGNRLWVADSQRRATLCWSRDWRSRIVRKCLATSSTACARRLEGSLTLLKAARSEYTLVFPRNAGKVRSWKMVISSSVYRLMLVDGGEGDCSLAIAFSTDLSEPFKFK